MDNWTAEQVEHDVSKPDVAVPPAAVIEVKESSTGAQGSGLTEAEREAGRDQSTATPALRPAAVHEPTVDFDLQDAPLDKPESRNRVMTPVRAPAEKRSIEAADIYSRDVDRSRRRTVVEEFDMTVDDGEARDDFTTVSNQSDDAADTRMDLLSSVDRRILASVILGVDITEVFSPIRVNQLAAKFGLVPGASLDLTNGWNF